MTLETKQALAAVERHLEQFQKQGDAGSIEVLIVKGKPLRVRIVKDEVLHEIK